MVGVYTAALHTEFAEKILVALLREQAVLSAALFPFSVAMCFSETPRCVFHVAVNTDVGSARNEQALCTQTSRWEHGSRGVSRHTCNSNPLWVWLWAGGIMYEFRGYMCTSFLWMRVNERQVFAGDFRRVLKLQGTFQRSITFMSGFADPREKMKPRREQSVCIWEEHEQVSILLKTLSQLFRRM